MAEHLEVVKVTCSIMKALLRILTAFLLIGAAPCAYGQNADSLRNAHFFSNPTAAALRTTFPKPPRVAVVLSGGSAKGLAHIGVLEILDSAHIPIDLIVGTSIGASIGGYYAIGYTPKDLVRFAEETNWNDVLDLNDESHRTERVLNLKDPEEALLSLRFTGFFHPVLPEAIASGQRLTMLINRMVLNAPAGIHYDFLTNLKVPFIAVATDILTGERVLLTRGDLTQALRASATVPLRFNPLRNDTSILVDGGLLSNIPVDVAKDSLGAEIVIASNTTAKLKSRDQLKGPLDIADQVVTLMMRKKSEEDLKQADFVITPELPTVSVDDFNNIDSIIEQGRIAARQILPAIQKRLQELAVRTNTAVADQQNFLLLDQLWHINFHGNTQVTTDSLAAHIGSFIGVPLYRGTMTRSFEEHVLAAYRSHGYSLARIDSVRLNSTRHSADVYLSEGKIKQIVLQGNDQVHPDVILRELPFTAGDVLQNSEIENGVRNVTGTGLFNFVSVRISPDTMQYSTSYILSNDTVSSVAPTTQQGATVTISVHPIASNVLRLGVLADNEYGTQFSAQIANENVLGSGTELSLKGGLGPLSRYAAFTFDAPRLFRSIATARVQAYTGYKDISTYTTLPNLKEGKIESSITDVVREIKDFGVLVRAGGQAGRYGALTGEYRIERQRYYSLRTTPVVSANDIVSAVRATLTIDTRNDYAYPQSGSYVMGFAEAGMKELGGTESYTKLFAMLQQTIPISSIHTLIPEVQAGFGDLTLPRMEQFSLGGMSSFYGLSEDEFRGRQMVLGSLTYQVGIPHSLFFPTFVSFRYDVGSTWLEPQTIKFEALMHGLGAQIGLKTPVGLAKFGIGENFRFSHNRVRPVDYNQVHYYFSIGSVL